MCIVFCSLCLRISDKKCCLIKTAYHCLLCKFEICGVCTKEWGNSKKRGERKRQVGRGQNKDKDEKKEEGAKETGGRKRKCEAEKKSLRQQKQVQGSKRKCEAAKERQWRKIKRK